MPMYDYRCPSCGDEFADFVPFEQRLQQDCVCGATAKMVWKSAPGIATDGNIDRDTMRAARSGVTHGTGNRRIPPFNGTTRRELRDWQQRHGLVAVSRAERQSGRLVINTKTKFTETAEFQRIHDRSMRHAMEVARAGEDAVRAELDRLEQPNEFDKQAFSQQSGAGLVAATPASERVPQHAVKDMTTAVASEIANG